MQPVFFARPADFRKWLERNHADARMLLVGYHKVDTGKPSMTWSQSVDEALCFGWIDGVRRTVDEHSYCIRFTPRKQDSTWSAIDLAKVAALKKAGRMAPSGFAVFEGRNRAKQHSYSYERKAARLSAAQQKNFQHDKSAWTFFCAQAPSYQRTAIHWVTSAKQVETRAGRLAKLIAASAKQRRFF